MTRITDIGCRIGKAHTLLQIKVRADRAISPEQTTWIEREMDRILSHNVDAIRLLADTRACGGHPDGIRQDELARKAADKIRILASTLKKLVIVETDEFVECTLCLRMWPTDVANGHSTDCALRDFP